jgi:methionyl-tRNA formyltransferase
MLKVVFAGTPEFAKIALEAIYKAGHEVVMVMTQPDRAAGRGMQLQSSPVKAFALEKNIPVIQPTSLRLDGRFSEDAIAALNTLSACEFDVMVVAAYGLILPKEVFEIAEKKGRAGCLNIHASLLPRWRGAAPIHRAIEAGDKKTGISIMQMDLGLDTGPVIAMQDLEISLKDTTASLHDKLATLGGEMILDALAMFDNDKKLFSVKQLDQGATYAQKILKEEAKVNWALSAEELDLKIRAFNPFPGIQFQKDGVIIKAWFSEVCSKDIINEPPGKILKIDKNGVLLASGKGTIWLKELQKPGGKKMAAFILAQSMGWTIGQNLE